ncbi:Primosomal protein 1 [Buchnera aphidicola (Neophyllaphis podocarpi)]|uniref:DnaT-like ssDNA-binding domain-containing protein n=1 Tax=Buchnera aphidicola TaxID=9 RepID=UPI00346404BE
MSTKTLKYNTDLKTFCKNPTKILNLAKEGIVEILKEKKTIIYVVSPKILDKLIFIKNEFYKINKKNNEYITKKTDKIKINNKINIGKFLMHNKWIPDEDFLKKAKIWGIALKKTATKNELALFISYWKAEKRFFHHIQWQQKLARSLQQSRNLNYSNNKIRDINKLPKPDQYIPEGFRGK